MKNHLVIIPAIGLCLCMVTIGCKRSELSPPEARIAVSQPYLTAEQAKDAVLEFLRSHPDTFIGSPDPERMAKIPLMVRSEGRYAFGAFTLDISKHCYTAEVGQDAPEVCFYNGTLELRNGIWTASEPKLTRFHKSPK